MERGGQLVWIRSLQVLFSRVGLCSKGGVAGFAVAVVAAVGLCASGAAAEDPRFSEYALKAAFLYNLLDFVDWPEGALAEHDATLTLCVSGEDPFGSALDFFEGKPVKQRSLRIRRIAGSGSLSGCAMVFVSESQADDARRILKPISRSPVLTVADVRGFTRRGGMVALLLVGDQVRIEINVLAARSAGLSISSKLLRLSRVVEYPPARGSD
jgi:hypothetical protein